MTTDLKRDMQRMARSPQVPMPASSNGQLKVPVLIAAFCSSLALLLSFFNLSYTRQITKKEFPSLVQLSSGETVEIGFEDPNYRSPEVITQFVTETLYYMMTMTSYGAGDGQVSALDPSRQKATPIKIKIGNTQGAIAQSAWLASEALEPKFADTFRAKLAQMTPPDVFTGAEEIILKFDYVKPPVEVNDSNGNWLGRWEVDVIANLKVFRLGSGEIRTVPFNKRVTLRPISTAHIHDVEQFGTLALALNASQRSGLQITDITDLTTAEVFR